MNNEKKESEICPVIFGRPPVVSPISFVRPPTVSSTCIIEEKIMQNTKKDEEVTPVNDEVVVPVTFSKAIAPITFDESLNEETETIQQSPTQASGHLVRANEKKAVEENTSAVTNYELFPKLMKCFYNKDGTLDEQKTEIDSDIIIYERHGTVKGEFTIRSVDIEKIAKIVSRQYPTAILYDKKDAQKVESKFRDKLSRIPIRKCYTDAGWQSISSKQVYVHNAMNMVGSEIITNLGLPSYKDYSLQDLLKVWNNAKSLYNSYEITAVLLLFSLLGVSYKLFYKAGFPIHFLLFINGKTGSFKTSLAKVLYTQLAEEKYRDNPRRIDADTPTSMERALVLSGRDAITLFDDYAPAKSLQKKLELANKLECIVRMVGDGSTKSRSNVTLEDCRGEGVKGVVVLTGELRGNGLSSNLRCLYCEIEKDLVNLQMLSWFQENKYAYTTLIQHFTNYLSGKWNDLIQYIAEEYALKRKMAEKVLKSRRLIDTLVTLWIVANIMEQFLVEYCGGIPDMVHNSLEMMRKDVISVVIRSELLSEDENPALIFMRAFETLFSNGKVRLKDGRLLASEVQHYDGFQDADYLYIFPDLLYDSVLSWLRKGGVYLGLDVNQLGNILCNEGYAVSTSNGANKKLYYARIELEKGNKVKFLKIPKYVLKKLQADR